MDQKLIAYGLMIVTTLVVVPWVWFSWQKHKRIKLRRRGIKTYSR